MRPSAPFERTDDAAGSAWELAKLVVLGCTLAPLRLLLWLATVAPMYGLCRGIHRAGLPLTWVRPLGRLMARLTLAILGFWPFVGVRRIGGGTDWAEGAVLVVANHVSWLDIVFFMAEGYQPSFVAKSGWIQAPLVGWFAATMFDCVVVHPSNPAAGSGGGGGATTSKGVATTAAITERLRWLRLEGSSDKPLLTFAEGTTSNGQYLLKFRTGAFRAALDSAPPSGGKVHCVVLRYPWRHFSPAWESIFPHHHLLRLLTQFSNTLQVQYLPPFEFASSSTPEALADDVRQYMAAGARPPLPTCESGYPEKQEYHKWLGSRLAQLGWLDRLTRVRPPQR